MTAVEIHERNTNDSPLLPSLLNTTAENFTVKELSADKAYASVDNIEAIHAVGAIPYVAFRVGITGASGGLFRKAFHFFSLHREEFWQSYHKRSNVESAFCVLAFSRDCYQTIGSQSHGRTIN